MGVLPPNNVHLMSRGDWVASAASSGAPPPPGEGKGGPGVASRESAGRGRLPGTRFCRTPGHPDATPWPAASPAPGAVASVRQVSLLPSPCLTGSRGANCRGQPRLEYRPGRATPHVPRQSPTKSRIPNLKFSRGWAASGGTQRLVSSAPSAVGTVGSRIQTLFANGLALTMARPLSCPTLGEL